MPEDSQILCRPFNNLDPPQLVALWQKAGSDRGLAQPLSMSVFESEVLAKPYFDPTGLIVAEQDGAAVGYIHAGFGPSDQHQYRLDYELGVICLVIVPPHRCSIQIEDRLLAAAEAYLRGRGARLIYGGQMQPLNPFYFGIYGGSELSGVVTHDVATHHLLQRSDYQACAETVLLERELGNFRPPLDRRFMQYRRQYQIQCQSNPAPTHWWQACQFANFESTHFSLELRPGSEPLGQASYWNMENASRIRGVPTSGLLSLHIDLSVRGQGLGTFLVAESLRQLQEHGVKLVSTQTLCDNEAARGLYQKLGFQEVGHSTVYRRSVNGPDCD